MVNPLTQIDQGKEKQKGMSQPIVQIPGSSCHQHID